MKKVLLTLSLSIVASMGSFAQNEPYKNPKLTPEERAEDLIGRLTLKEKVGLMKNSSFAVERLGVAPYNWWSEALHGVARNGLATVFPITMGMASTFDDEAIERVYVAVSDEGRAKFHDAHRRNRYGYGNEGLTFWNPNVNIFRDPRWGRGQETFGEDPYLTTRMGVAVVKGMQGPADAEYDKAHACVKHYAVHSGPEAKRHSFDVEDLSPRDLWETYLPAFKALVQEADVKEVMCAYQRLEGEPCCGSNRLLTQILRDEWGYKHLVVSDCGAIDDFFVKGRHETHKDAADASASAVINGTDLECGSIYSHLEEAVKQGLITEERIDTSLRRLLKARFALGEMDPDSIVKLLENKVVLIVPEGSDKDITSFEDVVTDKVGMIGLGEPGSVPVGQYSEEIFTSLGILDTVKTKANYGSDVRTVLSWVETGAVDCGVVYATDAYVGENIQIVCKAPVGSCKQVIYPVGIVKASENADAAAEFLAYLQTDHTMQKFEGYGFSAAE